MKLKNSHYSVKEILSKYPIPETFGVVKGVRKKGINRKWCREIIRQRGAAIRQRKLTMLKRKANKVKVGDILNVKRKHWYYIGEGTQVMVVTVIDIIERCGHGTLPLFHVEKPDGTKDTYTYKFFE